jgi:mono/diheme cytochrome c family protein/DNA-binding beta-propeller fold protein YncE
MSLQRLFIACAALATACTGKAPARETSSPPREPAPPRPRLERVVSRAGAPLALARLDGALIAYVADDDDRRLLVVDVDAGRLVGETPLDGTPAQIVTLPGSRLAIALRDRAQVIVLEGIGTPAWPLRESARVDVPAEPVGLATTPDDATLLVASGWGHALATISVPNARVLGTRELGREPRGVVASRDGKRAFVSHAVGSGLSIVDLEGSSPKPVVWHLEAESWVPGFHGAPSGPFLRRSTQAFSLALSEVPGGRVFVPHVAAHTAFGTAPEGMLDPEVLSGYGSAEAGPTEVFDVAVVDEVAGTPIDFEPRPDPPPEGARSARVLPTHVTSCLLPRAAVADRASLYVACMDTDRVVELDAASLHPERTVLRTWHAPRGPVGLAVEHEGSRLVVWSSLARSVTTLGLAGGSGAPVLASTTVLPRTPLPPDVERGRDLFHSGERRISGDGRACASCHPDGRDDGLVWATPDGPRQTPSLAGRVEGTAPYGWTGAARDLASHVPKTFKRLGGSGLTGADKDALLAYVRSMKGPPTAKASADARAIRGKTIFHSDEAGCASCHGPGGDLPDGERHDVRSWARGDATAKFDTPSLRQVGGTGPWFHDGRYRSLRDLIVKSDGKMGRTKHLSSDEVGALEAYLLTL